MTQAKAKKTKTPPKQILHPGWIRNLTRGEVRDLVSIIAAFPDRYEVSEDALGVIEGKLCFSGNYLR